MMNEERWLPSNFNVPYRNANCFVFGDVCSAEYNIILTDVHVNDTPERDISLVSVPGRNGDLTIDNHRWKNVDVIYSCAIGTGFNGYFESFRHDILSQEGYNILIDSIYDHTYRLAVLKDHISPNTVRFNRSGTFDITFSCKPQRYLKGGELAHTLKVEDLDPETGTATMRAAFTQPARPLITVYGSGNGILTVGGVTIDILSLEDQLTLDCELMTAYRQVGDGAIENRNMDIIALDFPVLYEGDNVISFSGGITHIEIKPRWWIL